jgi:predicted nucleic acid-binding protein
MPAAQGVLDTSTVIALTRLTDPSCLPLVQVITAITLAELAVGQLIARTATERARRRQHLHQAAADFEVLPFNGEAALTFGGVSASLRRAGRKAGSRTYDALIAAIALAHRLPLYTANPVDFAGIDGLEVVKVAVP